MEGLKRSLFLMDSKILLETKNTINYTSDHAWTSGERTKHKTDTFEWEAEG